MASTVSSAFVFMNLNMETIPMRKLSAEVLVVKAADQRILLYDVLTSVGQDIHGEISSQRHRCPRGLSRRRKHPCRPRCQGDR